VSKLTQSHLEHLSHLVPKMYVPKWQKCTSLSGIDLADEDKVLSNPGGANNPSVPTNLHRKQIQNFINAVKGTEPLLVDAHEGKRAVKTVCEIYKISK